MPRPLSAPPLPLSPETWLAFFRYRANSSGRALSPEDLGEHLGVSGATVRRWEKGTAAPTDRDLVRFGLLCGLSPHQIAFLRSAFNSFKTAIAPDHHWFRRNAENLLANSRIPMLLVDELMYARAWNSQMAALGSHTHALLDPERHPIECFFDLIESQESDAALLKHKAWKAVRSFWQFSAQFSSTPQYAELVARLHTYGRFAEYWAGLADDYDASVIDARTFGEIMLPLSGPRFRVVHSVVVFPPLFSVFEFEPENEEAGQALEAAGSSETPRVTFSTRDHWSQTVPADSQFSPGVSAFWKPWIAKV